MNKREDGPALTKNESCEIITSQFSESKVEIRNVLIDGEPWFIGSDVCRALGYVKPRNAITLHCRYALKQGIPHPQNSQKTLEVSIIPESDVYRLIMKSTLPSAESFERWVMEEVLPSLRKKGYYGMKKNTTDYLDARDMPYERKMFDGFSIRCITVEGETWCSINDIHAYIGTRTESAQAARKLNAKQPMARKVWLYGATHPGWFVSLKGMMLLLCSSRKHSLASQLELKFND